MGKLYLGTDILSLAAKLAAHLDETARQGDWFTPTTIVVPNHYLRKWLRIWLARRHGIAINLRFVYLEELFWELLRELDPRPHPAPVALLDDDGYRLLILAALLDEEAGGTSLAPLRDYLGRQRTALPRAVCRRAWHLALRLAERIKDYEYHRRDMILQWLHDQDSNPTAGPEELSLERSQRWLFRLITREPDGLRALLSRATGKLLKTLPQYAGEILEMPLAALATPRPRTVHVFGFTQISAFHHQVLRCLGAKYDVRWYHLNPLIGTGQEIPEDAAAAREALRRLANRYRGRGSEQRGDDQAPGRQLLSLWGQAAAEGLWLTAGLVHDRHFVPEVIASRARPRSGTVLHRLQDQLLDRLSHPSLAQGMGGEFLPQDRSLQIVACPGISREVETVYHSILYNLQDNPALKQTDIGVLVTDMPRYRPVLQAVFERKPRRLSFNIADLRAIGLSAYGHAVLGLLDLALESFTRSRVFAVLLNPCFLARLGVDHEQALVWLEWAEKLGIYHGWNPSDKADRGYPESPWYSWQLGLRRLRLGRLMDTEESSDQPALRFQDVLPFADLDSLDKEQLDLFCRAIEGLLPRLARLRQLRTTGENWGHELRRLMSDFLAVPRDRPEDQEVRRQLVRALANLQMLDRLAAVQQKASALPLALIREVVQSTLESLEGTTGEYLTGGVTIASLGMLLPLPFQVIYVLGLGEGLFPGTNVQSAFDLRSRQRCDGDVPPVEANRFLFLQALLAAESKIYLLFNCKDVQKDQELLPSSPVNQLRRYLENNVLAREKFEIVTVPLSGSDPKYLEKQANNEWTDVFVNYNETERLLALDELRRAGALILDETNAQEVARRIQKAQAPFGLSSPSAVVHPAPAPSEQELLHLLFAPPSNPSAGESAAPGEPLLPELTGSVGASPLQELNGRSLLRPPTITLAELRRFLDCPAEAAVRHHLHLRDDDESEASDDEPFYTGFPHNDQLIAEFLHRFVLAAVHDSVDTVLAQWRRRFAELHEEWRLRGRVPEEAFGQVDQARFLHILQQRITGQDGLAAFLRQRQDVPFCGPVLLGESPRPVGPRTRLPALKLTLPTRPGAARLVGSSPLVWRSDTALEVLVLTASKRLPPQHLSLPMLEPLLFFLALKAGTLSSVDWLGQRTFQLHVAYEEGLVTATYLPDDLSAAEAHAYLTELVSDFLDHRSFDWLPFALLAADNDGKLRQAYTLPDEAPELEAVRQQYAEVFQQVLAEDQDATNDYPQYRPMRLLEILTPTVPREAFAKIRRRFRLLDRGLARLRAAGGGTERGDD